MHTKLPKLALNQETLLNLTHPNGDAFARTVPIFFCKTLPSPTCPECPAPLQTTGD
jgi:hypothetical protein